MSFPTATIEAGTALGSPDVCNTPSPSGPVPVAYPNIGDLTSTDDVTEKVLVRNKPVVVAGSRIPQSQGDEAGSAGGVVSGTVAGEVSFRQTSMLVSAEGQKVVYATCATAHNGSNPNAPVGAITVPSQITVLVEG